jgi:PAS domain S-box-containing protein
MKVERVSRLSSNSPITRIARWLREHSLATKFLLLTLGGQLVLLAALTVHSDMLLQESLEEPFRLRVESLKPLFNSALAPLLVNRDYRALSERLDETRSDDDIRYLVVRNADDKIVASSGWDPLRPLPLASQRALDDDLIYDTFILIEADGRKFGTLNFGISTQKLASYRDDLRKREFFIITVGMLIIGLVQALLALQLTRRLRRVTSASEEVARGNFDMRLDDAGGDEVARLASSMNAMSRAVRDKIRSIEDSEEHLRMAMEAGSVVPWERDIAGDSLRWGAGVERLLGPLPAGQTDYPDLLDMIDADSRQRLLAARADAMQKGVPYDCDVRVRRTDGSVGWLAVRGKLVRGAGEGANYLIGVTRDVSASKLAELEIRRLNQGLEKRVNERTAELQAAITELEAFSHTISHDLRAPLRAMAGFSALAQKECGAHGVPEGTMGHLDRIAANASRMGQMLDDLLLFSGVSRSVLVRQRVMPERLVADLLQELQFPEAGRAQICIQAMPVCMADPALLRQVYVNLISNALKYSAKVGRPEVEVGAITAAASDVVYFVRDNGAGFDMRHAKNLFGVFQRLHSAKEFEGTGVGLSIVQRIILRHRGRIWAHAEPGKGATFYFSIPDSEA